MYTIVYTVLLVLYSTSMIVSGRVALLSECVFLRWNHTLPWAVAPCAVLTCRQVLAAVNTHSRPLTCLRLAQPGTLRRGQKTRRRMGGCGGRRFGRANVGERGLIPLPVHGLNHVIPRFSPITSNNPWPWFPPSRDVSDFFSVHPTWEDS